MTPEVAYFIKVNIAFVLFYGFYRLFFSKDTFFKLRRFILLSFFLLALAYPLMNFQEWVKEQEPMADVILMYSAVMPEVVIEQPAAGTDWKSLFLLIGENLYFIVIGLLFIRFLIQLGSIAWLRCISGKETVLDTDVYVLTKPAGPFSFFHWIFLSPGSHSDKELNEILMHENTHVSQWHSIDVIISEFICMICWFNPFAWLLKREVRNNLEYLADHTVLESGCDTKAYQYHLLGLAHQPHKAAANLYNNFNVLHLKNRISMMNRKRSRAIGRTKYLIFLPLVAILMLLSNIEAVARITKDMAQTAIVNEDKTEQVIVKDTIASQASEQIYTMVDDMPRFPGGDDELVKFLARNAKYPVKAIENKVQGAVVASFIINKDGSINDVRVVRSVDPLLDNEAIRVIKSMPAWTPGKIKGVAVAVRYTVPVTFKMQGKTTAAKETAQEPAAEGGSEQVFTVVEDMPQFPGGNKALTKYLTESVRYPKIAYDHGIQGRVVCSFIINTDGTVSDIVIARGVDPSLDREAVRVISESPNWTPGKQRGREVRVKYTLPVTFRLEKAAKQLDEVTVVAYGG